MPKNDSPLFSCKNIRVSVPGRLLVDGLNLELERGEIVAVLGPNGTGKSLTLATLAGLRRPDLGSVTLNSQDVFLNPRQRTAQQLALLPQVVDDIFPATVLDTALVGRHPHISKFRWESEDDYRITTDALRAMGLEDLSTRDVLTLSGGERRRLAIAQILAQTPEVYLLDEPTNHLDPQHQLDALQIFRRAADQGAGVVADRCLLLFGDGRWQIGQTEEILNESNLSELFATSMEAIGWRSHTLFVATSGHSVS